MEDQKKRDNYLCLYKIINSHNNLCYKICTNLIVNNYVISLKHNVNVTYNSTWYNTMMRMHNIKYYLILIQESWESTQYSK